MRKTDGQPAEVEPEIKVRRRLLTDYKKDPANLNLGNRRGKDLIRQSFEEVGPGRSLVSSEDDYLIAGNNAIDGATDAGILYAIEVDLPPDAVLVARRPDLKHTDDKARRLGTYDNRAGQVNLTWNPEMLLDSPDLTEGMWRDDELDDLIAGRDVDQAVNDKLDSEVSTERQLGDRKKQIKPVLYADEVATFEAALKRTGLTNRGQAVVAVCRFYLDQIDAQLNAE